MNVRIDIKDDIQKFYDDALDEGKLNARQKKKLAKKQAAAAAAKEQQKSEGGEEQQSQTTSDDESEEASNSTTVHDAPAAEGKAEPAQGSDEEASGDNAEPTLDDVKAYFKENQDKIDKFIELCVNSDKAKELELTADTFKKVITMTPDDIKKYLDKMGEAANKIVEELFKEKDIKEYTDNEDACKKLAEELHSKNEKIDTDVFFASINSYVADHTEEEEGEEESTDADEKNANEKLEKILDGKEVKDLNDEEKKQALEKLTAEDVPEDVAKKVLEIEESFRSEVYTELLKEIYG